jgi:hypothetical protein
MNRIVQILMERDDMTEEEAQELFDEAKDDLNERLGRGEMPFDICEEYFGLEPDYLDDLV